uniref:Reverse transcriptase domain-containing protein n=1 Tax=Strongyloides venezuelensis TaxID=75913 RepID=A0A0K0FFQ6_STRVS
MFQQNDFTDTGLPSNKESSVEMYTILSLLVKANFSNIAVRNNQYKFIDKEGINVLPVENSALTIFRNLYESELRRIIKECQVISPMQALLFGYKQIKYIGSNRIRVDDNVIFEGDPKFIQMIISLNALVDDLLKSLCSKKYLNEREMAAKAYIRNLIKKILLTECSINGYKWSRKIVTGFTKVDFRKIGGVTNWL